jgi:Cof subfamily protein (haloacid dehalogenase superfamily)
MYKAIVSDFDGTLVDSSLIISDKVQKAIKNYIKSGGIFSIATGRDYHGALKEICENLGIETLHIVRGGSEIVSSKTHQVVWGKYIDSQLLSELLAFLHSKKNIYFVAEREEKIYTPNGVKHSMFGKNAVFGVLNDLELHNVPKVFLPPPENKPDIVLSLFEELQQKFPQLHIIKTGSKDSLGIDINDAGVSKHLALLEYSKLMHVSPQEIIGIGDSYNDYPLLSACGYKVAMGNAPEELAQIADKIVDTQHNDGILELFNSVDTLNQAPEV